MIFSTTASDKLDCSAQSRGLLCVSPGVARHFQAENHAAHPCVQIVAEFLTGGERVCNLVAVVVDDDFEARGRPAHDVAFADLLLVLSDVGLLISSGTPSSCFARSR
jgi:hypothetical protein